MYEQWINFDPTKECGDDCQFCTGEACLFCGAGCWAARDVVCEHDIGERHEKSVDTPCPHGFAQDMACDDCGHRGFRFEGVNDGTVQERAEELAEVTGMSADIIADQLADEGPIDTEQLPIPDLPPEAEAPPAPHTLWLEAGGDHQKYRDLMIKHGHLVDRTDNPPEVHQFKGLTLTCPCSVCGGHVGASWHVAAGITLEKLEELAQNTPPVEPQPEVAGFADDTDMQAPVAPDPPKSAIDQQADELTAMAEAALADLRQRRAGSRKVSRTPIPAYTPTKSKSALAKNLVNACTCPPEGTEYDGPCDACRQAYIISIGAFEQSLPCSICGGQVVHEEGCREKRRQDMIARIFDGEPLKLVGDSGPTICFRCSKQIEIGTGAIVTTKGSYHMKPCTEVLTNAAA